MSRHAWIALLLAGCATGRFERSERAAIVRDVNGNIARAFLVDDETAWKEDALAGKPVEVCRDGRCVRVRSVESCSEDCPRTCRLRAQCPGDGDLLHLAQLFGWVRPYEHAVEPLVPAPTPPPPTPRVVAPVVKPPVDEAALWRRREELQKLWDEQEGRTRFEMSIGGHALVFSRTDVDGQGGGGGGGRVSIGFRREVRSDKENRREYREKEGPFLLLSDEFFRAFTGNQRGFDLRISAFGATSAPWVFSAGIAPVLRFHKNGSRWRFPSVFGAILPEVGVTVLTGRPALHIAFDPLPIAAAVTRHLAVEMHPIQSLFVFPFDGTMWMGAGTGLSFVIR
jgi:hypothetical protein